MSTKIARDQVEGLGDEYIIYAEEAPWNMVADVEDSDDSSGTDQSAIWQSILDHLDSTPLRRAKIWLPNGRIRIDSPIDYGVDYTMRVTTEGLGQKTEIVAGAAMTQMIRQPQVVGDTNQFANSYFKSIVFNAANLADYCIQGYGNNNMYRDLTFTGALVAGTDVSYGWNTFWDNCYWLSNADGCHSSGGQNNINTYSNCKWGTHSGFGVYMQGSYGVSFQACAFELCEKGAFIGHGITGLSFDSSCYFDNNGETGHTFTTPSVTVHADIILSGGVNTTTMATASPCRGVNISAPFVSQQGVGAHTFVYAISTESLHIDSPALISGEVSDLVTTYGSTTESSQYSRNEGLSITKPTNNFTNNFLVENSTTGFDGKPDMTVDTVRSFNILDSMSNWGVVVAGAATTFTLSSEVHPLGPLIEVYELDTGGSTSTSQQFGLTLDSADYPSLAGKAIVAEVDVKNELGGTTTVTVGGWDDTQTGTNWRTFYVIFNMPASGTFSFTVKKTGTTGKTFVSAPRLAELGSDLKRMVS